MQMGIRSPELYLDHLPAVLTNPYQAITSCLIQLTIYCHDELANRVWLVSVILWQWKWFFLESSWMILYFHEQVVVCLSRMCTTSELSVRIMKYKIFPEMVPHLQTVLEQIQIFMMVSTMAATALFFLLFSISWQSVELDMPLKCLPLCYCSWKFH